MPARALLIRALAPHPALRSLARRYLLVWDPDGLGRGRPVQTAPEAAGLLSLSLAVPNRHHSGLVAPSLGLRGIQQQVCTWTPQGATILLMVQLTLPGLMVAFSEVAADALERPLDLAALWGDARTNELLASTPSTYDEPALRELLDRLVASLLKRGDPHKLALFEQLWRGLTRLERVSATASHLGVSERWVQRTFRRVVGVGPKQALSIHRFQRSLRATQRADGPAALEGYADQAHQIRDWRRRAGITPGQYRRQGPSAAARQLDEPAFYL